MRTEKSAGAIVFRKDENKIFYLLLNYGNHWDFPKGNIEQGENEQETAKREIKEETGLNVEFINGFREKIGYFYVRDGDRISKTVIYFLAEAKSEDIRLSFEHKGFKWLKFEEALNLTTFNNSKNILEKANNFLTGKGTLKRFF